MPNRLIKEGIRTSKQIGGLDDFTFRTWTYLLTYVDDYGRGSADPELLKGFLFARRKGTTEKNIADALDKLACAGLVNLYQVDGEPFLYFPTWGKHQRIQTKCSKYPEPTEENEIPRESTVSHGESPLESNPIQSESNPNPSESNARARFTIPSVSDVAEYCKSRNNGIDPEYFCDYYTARDWKVGKEKMKDWKAAVRTWEKKDFNTGKAKLQSQSGHRQLDEDERRAIMAMMEDA